VDLDARTTVRAQHHEVVAVLADLGTYPSWLGIVASATPEADDDADAATASDAPRAWSVELAGRIGPFTRTKRVRMVRTTLDPDDGRVRFERRELDGRTHNDWVLTGEAAEDGRVHVHLHYGGRSLPGADLLLRQEVSRAGARLQAYLDRR
jgi:hypothetical protein